MTGESQASKTDGRIRETYEEFAVGETTVAMIADPHLETAWIQSDVVWQVVP